ncbi:tRNA:m4X modification enzyme, partial [Lunasporangiospora selenospora]
MPSNPLPPVICQHSVWQSKQQRFRNCRLAAKLDLTLTQQIQALHQSSRLALEQASSLQNALSEKEKEEVGQKYLDQFLEQRTQLLEPEIAAGRVLCGHHQKEAALKSGEAQETFLKSVASSARSEEQTAKKDPADQPVDPKEIPQEFLKAVERVFSGNPSSLVQEYLDRWDGPEEWKAGDQVQKDLARSETDSDKNNLDGHIKDGHGEGKDMAPKFPCHPSYETLFADAGVKKRRHLAQESQLIEAMETQGLLGTVLRPSHVSQLNNVDKARRPVFVEFGAGTGGLSRHVQLVLETLVSNPSIQGEEGSRSEDEKGNTIDPFNFILLDRQKFRSRNQVDYMIRTQSRPVKPRVMRITKDVRDLVLEDLQLIHETEPGVTRPENRVYPGNGQPNHAQESQPMQSDPHSSVECNRTEPNEMSKQQPTHYVCISKHFCGLATDLALKWIQSQRRQEPTNVAEEMKGSSSRDTFSLCFATCCHGICEPELVVAKPYLLKLFCGDDETGRKRKRAGSDVDTNAQDEAKEQVQEEQLTEWIPWIIRLAGWATLGKNDAERTLSEPDSSCGDETDINDMTRDQRR